MIFKRKIFLTMISMIIFLFLMLGITGSADTVFVDDDYYYGGANDGHIFGIDAFNKIQDGINAGGLMAINLPDVTVDMVVSHWGASSYFDTTLSDVPPGYSVANGTYVGHCVDEYHYITPGTHYDITLYSTYDPSIPWPSPNWTCVNYLINNKDPTATKNQVQSAIWKFVNGGYTGSDPKILGMINDAETNGTSFIPSGGQWIAVLCDAGSNVQKTFIEVLVPLQDIDCGTVIVDDGTYAEQITINLNLSLLGSNNPHIVAPTMMNSYTIAESGSTWYPIIFAYGGTMTGNAVSGAGTISVTIDGFEIDGLDQTGSGRYTGIFYRNIKPGCAGNTISNNDIHSMGVDGRATFGIEVRGDSDVTIEDNTVTGFSKGGIGLNGNANRDSDPTGLIQDNTITGAGQTTPQTWAPNGIQVSYGASGNIIDNEVSACGWPGTEWAGTGILVGDTSNVLIDDNYIYDCEQAIGIGDYPASWGAPFVLTCSDITASNNILDANSWGISIFNDVVNTLVEGNDIQNTVYDGIDVYNYGYGDDSPNSTVIVNNIIAYCGNGYDAIWLGENLNTEITRNYIHDNTNAIHIAGNSHVTMIEYNWILENDVGILVTGEDGKILERENSGFEPDGIEAYYNYIYSNCAMDIGIDNQVSVIVDATHNWFGADGPSGGIADATTGRIADGSGEEVIGNVHFDPWAGVDASGSMTPTDALTGDIIHYAASGFAYGGTIGPVDWNPDNYNYVLDGTPNNMQYFWDFDDGLYSFQQSGTHTYDSPGTYNVVLRVRALDGYLSQTDGYYGGNGFLFDFKQFTVTVSSPATPLMANADAGNFDGYEGVVEESIQFYGSATGGMPPYTYSWDFGDGVTSDLQYPVHTYETEGSYIAVLIVIDIDGTSVEDTADVTVYSPDELLADAAGPYAGMINEAIQFQGIATGGTEPYTFVWNFGDGSPIIQAQYPTYVYNEDGVYIATVTVTDSEGNSDDHTAQVTIIKEPGDTVEIKNIEGGFGVKATIQAGYEPVDWTINIKGKFVFFGGYADGRMDANAIQTVKIPFALGLGKVDITVTANLVVEERTGFMLGPFILSVK